MNPVVFLLSVVLILCSGVGRADEWIDLEKESGPALYGEKCGMCHRAGGMGTTILGRRLDPEKALLENRDDLQAPFVSAVVRNGFGLMFPLSRGEVSDMQLNRIADYLSKNNSAEQ